MNKLFVCNQGKYRSRTAATLFGGKFKGVYVNLKKEDLAWADIVYIFEEEQGNLIAERFPKEYLKKKILNLDIKDVYGYMNEKLVIIIKDKITRL